MKPGKLKYKHFIVFASLAVIAFGIEVILYGALLSRQIIGPELMGNLPIAIDTAYCFILSGASLLLQTMNISKGWMLTARTAAIMVSVCAFLSLLHDLSADFIIQAIPVVKNIHFGMSPHTAVALICMGAALAVIRTAKGMWLRLVQLLFTLIIIMALIVVIGHLFEVPDFHKLTFLTSMAVYTALALLLLSAAAALVNPSIGITAMFTGKLIGNIMARRIFLQMLATVLSVGYLHILDHRYNWFSDEFGSALQTIFLIIVGWAIIWETSRSLNKIDEKRKYAEENFKIAFNSSPYALVISDRQGMIRVVNYQTELLYGYSNSELVGQPVKLIIPPKMHESYEANREYFFENGKVITLGKDDEEILALSKQGKEFPIELTLIPIQTETGVISLSSVIDITERKTYEKIIKSQVSELQFKNQELEQFNYISSHDLQEPLRTVSNYIQLIEEDYGGQLCNEVKFHLKTIDSAIFRMSNVVRSLLDFGKLGKNKQLAYVNTNDIVNNVIADLNNLIHKSNATIEIDNELPSLYAYDTELRQLFQNLINNAIKFQRKDVAPRITIGSKQLEGYYEFFVSDNGIGMESKHFESIFHIFARVHCHDNYEGHGIGLANCKKITDMHGGKIWVESQLGKGSTFRFTILNFKA